MLTATHLNTRFFRYLNILEVQKYDTFLKNFHKIYFSDKQPKLSIICFYT